MASDERSILRTGPELVLARSGRWVVPGDLSAPLVVLVHGFTAHGRYLSDLAAYVDAQGFVAAIFNYDSYRGIDDAAKQLEFMVSDLDGALAAKGWFIVAHSMGGLVSRQFAQHSRASCRASLRGLATLGTPHAGTLSRTVVNRLLDWGDAVTLPNPFARSAACVSSVQLTDKRPDGLIADLNRHARDEAADLPMLSISGGLPFLEFGSRGGFAGTLRNLLLQRALGERPNDGLVCESSADITRTAGARQDRSHNCAYPAYASTNHSNLGRNQQVGRLLLTWMRALAWPTYDAPAAASRDD